MKKIIEGIRREYSDGGLRRSSLPEHPVTLMKEWLEEAIEKGITDPNTMIISTVSDQQKPSSRTVLLKDIDKTGLVFYTNYESKKAREISNNPNIAALFLWAGLERQVRIEGVIEMMDKKASDEYFASRPRESQIAAWASPQSQEISSREELEKRYREFEQSFRDKAIPRPSNWGGYKIIPGYFEFWQGRAGRLNDRVVYRKKNEKWSRSRLAP